VKIVEQSAQKGKENCMPDKINGVPVEILKEVDKQLALFKEGERIASRQKIVPFGLEILLWDIAETLNWEVTDDEILQVIKVYQGFLDNGGTIDFTKE
jgi:hypothetical protein